MREARFVAPARHEFLESVRHYEDAEPGLGVRLTEAVEEAILLALASPLAGTAKKPGVRRVLIRGFPYAVVYRPVENGILVYAIAHLARAPKYWRCGRL